MSDKRSIHKDFLKHLKLKDPELIELFQDLRNTILEIYPDANELLYHTHALTALFSTSERMSDAFCMIPIYRDHLNLGFNKGTLLEDPKNLLKGTGKLIRHVPIETPMDFRNDDVRNLIRESIDFALEDMDKPLSTKGKTISKIKIK